MTDPITNAVRLLLAAATEIKDCSTIPGTNDWRGGCAAKAAHDEYVAAAQALQDFAESLGAGGVQPLRPQQPSLVPLADVLARVDACAGPGSAVRLALEREFGQPVA